MGKKNFPEIPQRRAPEAEPCGRTEEHARAAAGAGLGIYAKYSAAPVQAPAKVDPETGEILGLARDPANSRWERFALQAAARGVLPGSRAANRARLRAKGREVQVIRSREHKTASYKGLQTCGSVWGCPVCAAKI